MKNTNHVSVLIADDHYIFRYGLKTVLTQQYSACITVVSEASNGSEALLKVKEMDPDLVLMDIQMPGMDGIEATKRIRQDFPLTRVVAMSGHNQRLPFLKMVNAGAKGYLLKDSDLAHIIAAITTVNSGGSYFVPEVSGHLLYKAEQCQAENLAEDLTEKECRIIQLVCSGYTNKEIGEILHHSKRTIDSYRENIMNKIKGCTPMDLFNFAVRAGLHKVMGC